MVRERSSRAARAAKAKPGSSGRAAKPRTVSHPLMDHRRIPQEHLWLVRGAENEGGWSVDRGSLIPATPAERWSEQNVRDESGLTADDWLAKDGLGQ